MKYLLLLLTFSGCTLYRSHNEYDVDGKVIESRKHPVPFDLTTPEFW